MCEFSVPCTSNKVMFMEIIKIPRRNNTSLHFKQGHLGRKLHERKNKG